MKEEKQKNYFSEKEFAAQWKRVEKEYPFVAIRYLELLNHISDEWHRRRSFIDSVLSDINLCDPESPIRAAQKFCDELAESPTPIDVPPPPCRPARGPDDLDRYLECLRSRLG